MAAVTALKTAKPIEGPLCPPERDGASLALLTQVRLAALECRAAARTDLFEACALLSNDRTVARSAHADALMKCLPQATGKPLRILRPGEAEVTFDEAWILALTGSLARSDSDSFAFLLRSRVAPWARRNIGFLLSSITDQFYQI
ncbi:MAG: hypothetical protein AAFQ79_07435 [Pseudomonadota bacterium]